MLKGTAKVVNVYGIHCRPTAEIIKQSKDLLCSVTITSPNGLKATLKSMIELLMMALKMGDEVQIEVNGENEEIEVAELAKIQDFFSFNYDFKRDKE